MRRLILLLIAAFGLALPAGALALRSSPGDGTLVVDNALGSVTVRARGGIIGHFDQGQLIVEDPNEADGKSPVVYGAEQVRDVGPKTTVYSGDDVRFRMTGGAYRVQVQALGIDISAVGRGSAVLDGSGFRDRQTGRYSVNGSPFQKMPATPTKVNIGQPQAAQQHESKDSTK
ncbi:MAG TPA: hypothetical protein VJT84_07625 [Gaiellaceae bacterium]|nr:hypothetical protein [Gaiellaceae bacterium]